MLGKTKKITIVCDEKTEVYANYLRQLISSNDDKDGEVVGVEDGTVDAAVWDEKDYDANKAKLSSNGYILFIGDSKTCQAESSSMDVKYDKYGMMYGWLGKRAMMRVDNESLDTKTYDEFIEYGLKYKSDLEKLAIKKNNGVKSGVKMAGCMAGVGAVAGAIFLPLAIPAMGIAAGVTAAKKKSDETIDNSKLRDQKYRVLSVVFYLEGLQEFLEG